MPLIRLVKALSGKTEHQGVGRKGGNVGVEFAALVTWILAAIVGLYLLTMSLANGGLRGQATKVTRFPATLRLSHLLLGLSGLVVRVFFLITMRIMYAWAAFALLVV